MLSSLLLLALATAAPSPSPAPPASPGVVYSNPAQSARQGDYTLHFMALPTVRLSPEVARRSGVTRSANRALLNLSLRRGPSANSVAVTAPMRATARNLLGQVQPLNLREVREGDAIYYLAEARIEERDTLNFEVEVALPDARPLRAAFSQEFWPAGPARP